MIRGEPRSFRRHSVIITHIFWSISVNRGDKAFRMGAFVHKLCPVIPLHKRPQKDMGNDDVIVRAGAVWSGVGTLAVALGMRCARERAGTLVVALTMPYIVGGRFRTSRCSAIVQSRDAFQALLSLSALCAVLQRCRAWSGGRPGG